MKNGKNSMKLEFCASPENETLARVCIAAFASGLNPPVEKIIEIKPAVSEAVTNAVVHGYGPDGGVVTLSAYIRGDTLHISVSDKGRGIEDVEKAMQPFYTTAPEYERSGMGFSVMESFMDSVRVKSVPGKGTTVKMSKIINEVSDDAKA